MAAGGGGGGSSGDDWPYYFLNSLSPNAGPTPANPLTTATTVDGLSLPVDSVDLQRQLEAWTNITFDFDDEDTPSSSSPQPKKTDDHDDDGKKEEKEKKEKEGKKMAGMMSTSTVDAGSIPGYHLDSLFGSHSVPNPGDASPYDPRRGVGTGHHHMHQLFPGPQEHAFRLPHHHQQHLAPPNSTVGSPHLGGAFSLPPLLQPTSAPLTHPQPTVADQQSLNFTAAPISFSSLLTSPDGLNSLLRASGNQGIPNPATVANHNGTGSLYVNLPEIRPYITAAGTAPTSFSELIGGTSTVASVPMTASSSLAGGNLNPTAVHTPSIEEPSAALVVDGAKRSGAGGKKLSRRASTNTRAAAAAAAATVEEDLTRTPSENSPLNLSGSSGGDKGLLGLDDDEANRLAIEEDKRRRNTAASARFRIKKKLREQAIERTAQELRDRVTELEKEVDGLKKENGWLRGLIVERAARDTPGGAGAGPSAGEPQGVQVGPRSSKRRKQDD